MSFRDDAQLDPSEVSDQRGRGGAGRIAIGGGGLGLGGLVIIVLLQLLGGGGGLGQLGELQDQTSGAPAGELAECRTGADANERQDCRILGYVNSVQRFWRDEFARRGRTYHGLDHALRDRPVADRLRPREQRIPGRSTARPTGASTSTSASSTSCATASARAAARSRRATWSPTSTGITSRTCSACSTSGGNSAGATGTSVRTELQADCFAGVWADHATETGLLEPLTQAQIDDALSAAAAVGDDRIQQQTQGTDQPRGRGRTARPRSVRNGSRSASQSGDMRQCDTFAGSI